MNKAETRHTPSLDQAEADRFEALADQWWSEAGKFKGLHAFNPARLKFIVDTVAARNNRSAARNAALTGLSILDIGCGGGILSEPLARLGAKVTGVDPVSKAIDIAKVHAAKQNLSIEYRTGTAEDLASEERTFDLVIASEVIEHVADVGSFLSTCRKLTAPGGLFIVSTLNRTAKSYALAIVAAEQILGMIAKGTHDWRKFIKPDELATAFASAGFETLDRNGIVFRPLIREWALSPSDLSVNYIVSARAV